MKKPRPREVKDLVQSHTGSSWKKKILNSSYTLDLKSLASLAYCGSCTKNTVSTDKMGLNLTFGLHGSEQMTTHHLPHHMRHHCGLPWLLTQTREDCSKRAPRQHTHTHSPSTSTCSTEISCSSSLMSVFGDRKKGCRRACPGALQTTLPPPPPNRPEQPEEPTWQAEAPLYLSLALTHTQALLGTGPGMSRQDTIVECLPAHLPVLSTPRPHTRQGTGHISGVAKPLQMPTCLPRAIITMPMAIEVGLGGLNAWCSAQIPVGSSQNSPGSSTAPGEAVLSHFFEILFHEWVCPAPTRSDFENAHSLPPNPLSPTHDEMLQILIKA